MPIEPHLVRAKFPSLTSPAIYIDNPGGTQVPYQVVDRMVDYLVTKNANQGGAFATSLASDDLIAEARQACADFLNAADPAEIVFGPNMTSLTFSISRSLARELGPGDEIVVTRLDHSANVCPWLLIARDRGCTIRWLDFDIEDCTLRMDQLAMLLNERTKLVAVGYASNAVGTINPLPRIVQMAHQAGALCYVDAVQFAPHGPIDVQALGSDFLVYSAYKIFGPHVGVLHGRREHLERLHAYKVRPAPEEPPQKFETGTQNHEGIAGLLGSLEYLTWLGEKFGAEHTEGLAGSLQGRRLVLKLAMTAIGAYETGLTPVLIGSLRSIQGLRIYGISDPRRLDRRVPTVAFTLKGYSPRRAAEELGRKGIHVWDGNYFAVGVTECLGLEAGGGMIRVGLVHYNVETEIQQLEQALREMVGS